MNIQKQSQHESSSDDVRTEMIRSDMKYTITYQNVGIQTKADWLRTQFLGINWTNLALLLTVIALSSSSQSAINRQNENNGQAAILEKKISDDITELKLILSELNKHNDVLEFIKLNGLNNYNDTLNKMLIVKNNITTTTNHFEELLASTSIWKSSVDTFIDDRNKADLNKFIKRNQRLGFNTAVVKGVYTYYTDGISFCLTKSMRLVAHCFLEYRNNVDMGVTLYIHLNETNTNQRGINQGNGGWFNVHNIAIFNLIEGCYNIKASVLFTDFVLDVNQFCEIYSFD